MRTALYMTLVFLVLAAAIIFGGCNDHATPAKVRTDGAMEGPGWVEVERRAVGDKVYIRSENATEVRWVEVLDNGLGRSRVMSRKEQVPK